MVLKKAIATYVAIVMENKTDKEIGEYCKKQLEIYSYTLVRLEDI